MRNLVFKAVLICFGLILTGHLFLHDWKENQIKIWTKLLDLSLDRSDVTVPVAVPWDDQLKDEITVVTAYFKLEPFKKGISSFKTPEEYHSWMSVFRRIQTPMVIFVDNNESYQLFREFRQPLLANITKLFLIEREDLWSFGLVDKIRAIYEQPFYPKHHPNTVIPEYSCAMHAKFELVERAIQSNFFRTKYFSWLDIGLFRKEVGKIELFKIQLPPNFREEFIAYSEVYDFDQTLTDWNIIKRNKVWVGGAMFLGRHDVTLRYTNEYKTTVLKLIDAKMMSTDQQVIYSMFLPSLGADTKTRFQLYTTGSSGDWFLLGYLCQHPRDSPIRGNVSVHISKPLHNY